MNKIYRTPFTGISQYNRVYIGLIVLGCLIFPVAAGDKLFSVDPDRDTLVVIDADSLAISEIGPLGVDILNTDGIVTLNNNELLSIFVLPESDPPYGHYALYKINTITGQATWVADIFDGDGNPDKNLAESIARNPANGKFFISYSSGAISTSDLLGTVDPVTGSISYNCPVGLDMDMIEFSPTGSLLYANDVFPENTQITQSFYSINPTTCNYMLEGQYVTENQYLTDMELLSNGDLIGVEKDRATGVQNLVKIEPDTGSYSSLGLLAGYRIDSLCLQTSSDPSPIPEFPSTLLPVTMIIGFLGAVLFIRKT